MKQLLSLLLFLCFLSSPFFAQNFIDQTKKSTLDKISKVNQIEHADFNLDGNMDLIMSGKEILINDGTGNFKTQLLQNDLDDSFKVIDLDNDGDADIVFLTILSSEEDVKKFSYIKFINDGTGNFSKHSIDLDIPTLHNSNFEIGDIDSDNDIDLIVSGRTLEIDSSISVYASKSFPITYLLENKNDTSFILYPEQNIFGCYDANSKLDDIDGDGDIDIVIGGNIQWHPSWPSTYVTKLYMNNGIGIFQENIDAKLIGANRPKIKIKDLNLDGNKDIIISGPNDYSSLTETYLNDGVSGFEKVNNEPFQGYNSNIDFIDINNDGFPDILLSGFRNITSQLYPHIVSELNLYINQKNGRFLKDTVQNLVNVTGELKVIDLDNDGNEDFIVNGYRNETRGSWYENYVYKNGGNGRFLLQGEHSFGELVNPASSFIHLNNDQYPDLILAGENQEGDPQTLLFCNEKNGEFVPMNNTQFPNLKSTILLSSDFNNDKKDDLYMSGTEANGDSFSKVFIKTDSGNFSEQALLDIKDEIVERIKMTDINGDTINDFGISGMLNQKPFLYLFLGSENGVFTKVDYSELLSGLQYQFDFGFINDDQLPDLFLNPSVWSSEEGYNTKAFFNSNGSFSLEDIEFYDLQLNGSPTGLKTLIDIDGDGDHDIFNERHYGWQGESTSAFFRNDAGQFKAISSQKSFGNAGTAVADFNNDQTNDLIAIGRGKGSYSRVHANITFYEYNSSLFVNVENRRFKETCDNFKTLATANIIAKDIDLDGDIDLFVSGTDLVGLPDARIYLNDGSASRYSIDEVKSCDSSYTWINGETFYSSNYNAEYIATSDSIAPRTECNPTVLLYLNLFKPSFYSDTVNATGEYQWIDGNTYYESNNTATYTLTNQSGCDSTVSLNLTLIPLANELESSIVLYPNPSGEHLKLDLGYEPEENFEYQIFNTSGLEIKTWESSLKEQVIDISRLPLGTYIIKYQEGLKSESLKFVKR